MTEDLEKEDEERKTKGALSNCGYPDWSIDKAKKSMSMPKQKPPKKKEWWLSHMWKENQKRLHGS